MPNQIAPPGQVYVCTACGKCSRDQHGDQALVQGWDVSCMLNCALVDESKITIKDGYAVAVSEDAYIVEEEP